ncbi:unnamed protein product [Rhizoctonia solani]|uniref:t-SNARE coiled-coil homology domain-containing protein n=1 Tax=Rhizoctonia solani TaxID=456999 RepID=A0A8H3C1A2_9AGAM|nr:unnamed protein product [Rhizoctonia solani]
MPRLFNRSHNRNQVPTVADARKVGTENDRTRSELLSGTHRPSDTSSPHPRSNYEHPPDPYCRNARVGDTKGLVTDDNLDEIHDVAKRLKGLAEASGQELDTQNPRLGRISNSADRLDAKVVQTTGRLKRIK